MSKDYLEIPSIDKYLPPDESEIKIGSDDPQSKDVLFTPGVFDPSSTGKWGNQLNEGTFKQIQVSFNEIKAYIDDEKPIIDQLVDYTNELDLHRKNTELKGFGIRSNQSGLTGVNNGYLFVHGYDHIGLPTAKDGWFYLQSDVEQTGANAGKLIQKRQVLKSKSLGLLSADCNNDLLFVMAKLKPGTNEWHPFIVALKEEQINETTTTNTLNEWDRNSELRSKSKTVQTGLKYPNHDVRQYQLVYAANGNDGSRNVTAGQEWIYEQQVARTISTTERKFDSANELSVTSTNGNYTTTKEEKQDYLLIGMLNADYNAGTTRLYNCVSFMQPLSFDLMYEQIKSKREQLKQRIKQFTEAYQLFDQIQEEIEERIYDVNVLKADVEQNIREFLLKQKGDELYLEHFNHLHDTKYNVLTKGNEYPTDIKTTKRLISAELLSNAIKQTWLHGTDSTKVLMLGRAANLINSESLLKTGLTVEGNLRINESTLIDKTLTVTGTTTLNGATTVNNTLSIPNHKTTSKDLQVTNTTQLNVLNVTGTTTATGVVNLGSTSNATNVKGRLNIDGVTTANGLVTANQGVTIPTGKKLITDLADINTLVVNTAQTNNGTTVLNGTTTTNNNTVLATSSTKLTVRGDTTFDRTTTTTGNAQFNNNVTVANTKTLTTDIQQNKTFNNSVVANINQLNVATTTVLTGKTTTKADVLNEANVVTNGSETVKGKFTAESTVDLSAVGLMTTVKGNTTLNQTLLVTGTSTFASDVVINAGKKITVPIIESTTINNSAKTTTATLQTTGTTQLNTLNITGVTTSTGATKLQNNVELGTATHVVTNKAPVINELATTTNGIATFNNNVVVADGYSVTIDQLNVNNAVINTKATVKQLQVDTTTELKGNVTVPTAKITTANLQTTGTSAFNVVNTTGTTTATGIVNLGSTANATNVKGTLNVTGITNTRDITVLSGSKINTDLIETNTIATKNNSKVTITSDVNVTAQEFVSENNIKAKVLYQNGKALDEIYLQKYQGSTGVAALNIPRETGFLVQRNTTDQITTNRCIGYEDMLFDEQTKRFYLDGIVNFYPDVNSLKFKGTDNFVQFDCYKEIINNKHLFVAFDVNEIPTKEKDLLTIELSDSKKIIFKINEELKLAIYLDSVKLNESDIFKDIDILRECFGLIIKNEKLFLIHDGETKAQFNLSGIKNQTIKLITIGSKTNSLLFDLYTLMIGNFDNSQWSNLEVGTYYINNQYSQEVYQCFGNFKYNENLDKVNFSFESSALPNATLLQKGIVKLTNTIEDREDLAVTPRALIDFNVQSIYESKYQDNLEFNINQGLTDTVFNLTPIGYESLKINECFSDGTFSNLIINGKINKNGISLNDKNKLRFELNELNNWCLILEWKNKQFKDKSGTLKLFDFINFGTIPTDIKTLEKSFKNILVIHQNGNVYFNGSKLSNLSLNSIKIKELKLISTQEFYIKKLSILKNLNFEERELRYISQYGFETEISIENAPLYYTNCNWNQLRQVLNYTDKQIEGIKEKVINKEINVGVKKISFNEIIEDLISEPKFFIDGELLSKNFYTWNVGTKEFELKGISFTHKKEIICLYNYKIKDFDLFYSNVELKITRKENTTNTNLTLKGV